MNFLALLLSLIVAGPALQAGGQTRLEGQLSGLPDGADHAVDLELRFFAHARGGDQVAERRYEDVAIMNGQFAVSLDPAGLGVWPLFVEVGIRPAGRRYADFRAVPPRRELIIDFEGDPRVLIAQIPVSTAVPETTALMLRASGSAHAPRLRSLGGMP